MSLADKIKEQEEAGREAGHASQGGGGDWFKFQEGENSFRVLEEPEMIFEKFKVGICYTDCGYEGSTKFMTYVLDRADGKIKIAKLPYKIGTIIAGYETDEDYAFDGFPMDFDVKVTAKNAGTKEVDYTVTPRPTREPVDADTAKQLLEMNRIVDVIERMKEKKKAEHVEDGTWQAEQDRKKGVADGLAEAMGGSGGALPVIEDEEPFEEPKF